MLPACVTRELEASWFPHMTETGLDRVLELLESASPMLIHGAFSRSVPMGCLATHIAWHHPDTESLTQEAGIVWLTRVAGMNPATSTVIREWDGRGANDWRLRDELADALRAERDRRAAQPCEPAGELQAV